MLGSIGMPEMIVILVIALIVFGPRKLPELGRSLGKSLGEFKRASNDLRNTLEDEIRVEERRTAPASTGTAKPGPPSSAPPAATSASAASASQSAPAPVSGTHPAKPDAST